MSPLSKTGQLLKIVGILFAGAGVFLTGIAPTLAPGDFHDVIFGAAIVFVALGSIIARQGASS